METLSVPETAPIKNPAPCPDLFSHPRQTRILLVEDNPINQRVALKISPGPGSYRWWRTAGKKPWTVSGIRPLTR
nr:hypothetical protein [Desulfobacula sp.]